MLKEKILIKEHLQRKREKYIHQKEKMKQFKCTLENTEEEIKQLEYVIGEMEHILEVNRELRVVPNNKVSEVFIYLCQMFDFLEHHFKQHFKYKLTCEVRFARYQFQSRFHTSGLEYLSFANVLTYFKQERGMTSG